MIQGLCCLNGGYETFPMTRYLHVGDFSGHFSGGHFRPHGHACTGEG